MKIFYIKNNPGSACAAAIIYRHFEPDCEVVGLDNANSPFPLDQVEQGEKVVLAGFTPDHRVLKALKGLADLEWWEHRRRDIDTGQGLALRTPPGALENSLGSCGLVWLHYYGSRFPCPYAVRLLAEHGVRNFHDPNTRPFHRGVQSVLEAAMPDSDFWDQYLAPRHSARDAERDVEYLIGRGAALLSQED